MFWSRKKSNSNEIIKSVYDLIITADRAMPAYFNSNYKDKEGFTGQPRPKTFNINFEINPTDEYDLAGFVWQQIPNTNVFEKADHLFTATLIMGEDITVGTFIISRLGHEELIPDLVKFIIKSRLESFAKKGYNSNIINIDPLVLHYFSRCIEFGKLRANLDDKQKNSSLPLSLSWTDNNFKYYRELR